ncbi:MAG: hypothetical protein WAK82_35275, partial [Streptosporangiaceae bacterium]
MASQTGTTRRVRLVTALSVVGAVTIAVGGLLVIAGATAHVLTKHPPDHLTHLGLAVGAAGIAFGLVVLAAYAFTRKDLERLARAGASGVSETPASSADPVDHRTDFQLRASAPSPGPAPDPGRPAEPGAVRERSH